MRDLKENIERVIGDKFINALNAKNGSNFAFAGRPDVAPDLTYRDGRRVLNVEVTTGYYDTDHATLVWDAARGKLKGQRAWGGVDFESKLVAGLDKQLEEKCGKDYGANCVLLIYVDTPLTGAHEMEALLAEVKIPTRVPFVGIYLSGALPQSSSSLSASRWWRLALGPST